MMESHFDISATGTVRTIEKKRYLQIDAEYIPGLTKLEGFSHLQIVWWAHLGASTRKPSVVDEA